MNDISPRVFLVDDHPLVREWLGNLVRQQPGMSVCGEAESADDALEAIIRTNADVAIIDLSLRAGSGLDLIRRLKIVQPKTLSIVLSMHDEKIYGERALRAGARGYIMKQETTRKVILAIRTVVAQKLYFSETIQDIFPRQLRRANVDLFLIPPEILSDRELEVFELLGRGIETRAIAETLGLSIKTVQAYCQRIKDKLNLANAAELMRAAVEWNLRSM